MNPLVLLAVAYLLHFASSGVHLPLAASALATVGLAPSLIGTVFALRSCMHVLAPTLWGALADKRGNGAPFAMASLFFGGMILLALGYAESSLAIVLCFALYGIVGAPSSSLLDGVTLTALGPHKAKFGHIRLFGTIGFGVTALLANVAIGRGWVTASPASVFITAAVFSVLAAMVLVRFPVLPRERMSRFGDLWGLFRLRAFWVLTLVTTLQWSSHAAYTGFVVPLGQARGIGSSAVGLAIALGIALEVVAMRNAQTLLQRFGAWRLLSVILLVSLLRWVGLAFAHTATLYIVLNGLHGVTFGLFFPVMVTLLAERTPERLRQSAQGALVALGFGLGGALGSLAAGIAFEAYGARETWLLMAVPTSVTLILALWAKRHVASPTPA